MPPAGYPAFLQYLQSGRVRKTPQNGRAEWNSLCSMTMPDLRTSAIRFGRWVLLGPQVQRHPPQVVQRLCELVGG